MSHTVKVKIELKNRQALEQGVLDLGGTSLGEGKHKLYADLEEGFGFTLPQWRYPLVAKENGTLAYDDFNGRWGRVADVDRLKERYALSVARGVAQAQGWVCQEAGTNLLVFHPDGGTLTITPSTGWVDAAGFEGQGCASATAVFEAALGQRQEETLKDEFFAERAHVAQGSSG